MKARSQAKPLPACRAKTWHDIANLEKKWDSLDKSGAPDIQLHEMNGLIYDLHQKRERIAEFRQVFDKLGEGLASALEKAAPVLRQEYEDSLQSYLTGLIKLNPELQNLPVDRSNLRQVRDVVGECYPVLM